MQPDSIDRRYSRGRELVGLHCNRAACCSSYKDPKLCASSPVMGAYDQPYPFSPFRAPNVLSQASVGARESNFCARNRYTTRTSSNLSHIYPISVQYLFATAPRGVCRSLLEGPPRFRKRVPDVARTSRDTPGHDSASAVRLSRREGQDFLRKRSKRPSKRSEARPGGGPIRTPTRSGRVR